MGQGKSNLSQAGCCLIFASHLSLTPNSNLSPSLMYPHFPELFFSLNLCRQCWAGLWPPAFALRGELSGHLAPAGWNSRDCQRRPSISLVATKAWLLPLFFPNWVCHTTKCVPVGQATLAVSARSGHHLPPLWKPVCLCSCMLDCTLTKRSKSVCSGLEKLLWNLQNSKNFKTKLSGGRSVKF